MNNAYLITNAADIFYLTGYQVQDKRELYLLKVGDQIKIITFPMLFEQIRNSVADEIEVYAGDSGEKFSDFLAQFIKDSEIECIIFDKHDLTFAEYELWCRLPSVELKAQTGLLAKERREKGGGEMDLIEEAVRLAEAALLNVLPVLTPGTREIEFADVLEGEIRQLGAEPAFDSIVAFAENTSYPHHSPSQKKLEKGMPVLIDWGARLKGYHSDMTVSFWFGDRRVESAEYEECLQKMQNIFNGLVERGRRQYVKHGEVKVSQLYDFLEQEIGGYKDLMPHLLGHGIGLEVHEEPRLIPEQGCLLKPGDVITLEPAVYFPGEFGIRLEKTIALRGDEFKPLGKLQVDDFKVEGL